MAQDPIKLIADKNLEKDLTAATSYEDLQSLLHNAVERSGIAERDPITGQFVRRDPAAAAAVAADADKDVTKTEVIGGHEFTFTGTQDAVDAQILSAQKVANALQTGTPHATATPAPARVPVRTTAEIAQDLLDRQEIENQFRQGLMTTADYLERSGAVDEYLSKRGFDVQAAAEKQMEQSWADATQTFLNGPAGADWPGGNKNLVLIGDKLKALGLEDATDKVAALTQAYAEMKKAGTLFDGDYTPEQVNEMTAKMTPAEILQAWKEKQDSPEAANAEFIRLGGGTGGMFNK